MPSTADKMPGAETREKGNCDLPGAVGGNVTEENVPSGPKMVDKTRVLYPGTAAIGLVFSRYYGPEEERMANAGSTTRQTQYDLNQVQDRRYEWFCHSNDDGWLCGGGESGEYCKLPAVDSAHLTIHEPGTLSSEWGGLDRAVITKMMTDGSVLIPHMSVLPSYVWRNPDAPPEVELKFCLERDASKPANEWANWTIVFVGNQLFHRMRALGCAAPHAHPCIPVDPAHQKGVDLEFKTQHEANMHVSMVRKAAWRSAEHYKAYFQHCDKVVNGWREMGPQLLTPETDPSKKGYPCPVLGKELEEPYGLYLWKTRNEVIEYFPPNFLPPYDTPEKLKVIEKWLNYTGQEEY